MCPSPHVREQFMNIHIVFDFQFTKSRLERLQTILESLVYMKATRTELKNSLV